MQRASCREGDREDLITMVRLTVRLLAMAKKNMQAQMEYYSKFSPSPLSIKQFMDFGKYIFNYIAHSLIFMVGMAMDW